MSDYHGAIPKNLTEIKSIGYNSSKKEKEVGFVHGQDSQSTTSHSEFRVTCSEEARATAWLPVMWLVM